MTIGVRRCVLLKVYFVKAVLLLEKAKSDNGTVLEVMFNIVLLLMFDSLQAPVLFPD